MLKLIVVLTGRIASGKSTLTDELVNRFDFHRFKTNDYIKALAAGQATNERGSMQEFGEELDRKTKGAWVSDGLLRFSQTLPKDGNEPLIVVDAVRIEEQIEALRDGFGSRVVHIHLTASEKELEKRFKKRKAKRKGESLTFQQASQNPTESKVEELADVADIVINTEYSTEEDVVVRAAAHLGLYGREYSRLVDVLVGGQYGSEGKGHIASYLANEYDILVRVGGPNAGHKVYYPKYTFHQIPSGANTNTQAKLLIGPGAVIDFQKLLQEIGECEIDHERLAVDPQVMIIEHEDVEFEKSLIADIASTGQGVGVATARRVIGRGGYATKNNSGSPKSHRSKKPLISKGLATVRLAKDVKELKPFVRETYKEIERAFSKNKKIFIEGTQGTALSLYHGFYPHVTSRDTTIAGCLAESGISPSRVRKVVMVCRTFPIRVGNAPKSGKTSGPMSREISLKEIARRSGYKLSKLQSTERTSTTNRERRIAEFDWSLIRKAATLNAPTDIALTFADYIDAKNENARRFEQLTDETIQFIQELERVVAAPVSLISTRFHTRSIIDRRSW